MTPAPNILAAAQDAQRKWGIPASVSLAQFGLESGWGAHDLGCFNYFGMKAPCDANEKPTVPFVIKHTREEDRYGHSYFVDAPFRKFSGPSEAFDLHAKLLATAPVYEPARAKLPDVRAFVVGMAPRYASAHDYADQLWAIITGSGLLRFDVRVAANDVGPPPIPPAPPGLAARLIASVKRVLP